MWGDSTPPTLGPSTPGTAGRKDQNQISGIGSAVKNLMGAGKKIASELSSKANARKGTALGGDDPSL